VIGQTVRFRHDQHRIVDAEIIRWLRRQVVSDSSVRDNLFLYRHTHTGNFIVAVWVGTDRFQEVYNLGWTKGCGYEEARKIARMLNRPSSGRGIARAIQQHQRDILSRQQDKNDKQVSINKRRRSNKLSVSMAGAR